MNTLDIKFKELLPLVVDAYTSVYGDEYRNIISERVNRTIIVQYFDLEGLDRYLSDIRLSKKREYSIRFLEEIGIDVEKYKKDNYMYSLGKDVQEILSFYFGLPYIEFDSEYTKRYSPLCAFNLNNNCNAGTLLKNKLILINYLRGNSKEQITKDNFDVFSKTDEYSNLLVKINNIINIYNNLLNEYNIWEKKLLPYEEYIDYEEKRKKNILEAKKNEVFKDIFDKLSNPLKEILKTKSLKEQQNLILGDYGLSFDSVFELFRKDMSKLNSPDTSIFEKNFIISYEVMYLQSLGIKITDESILNCKTEDDIKNYLSLLNQSYIKELIPSNELVDYIIDLKTQKYEEAIKTYYMTRDDFTNALKLFAGNENDIETIYYIIKNKLVCAFGGGATNSKNEFLSLMFYSIRNNTGYLFYTFLHEMGHIIEQNPWGSGFETINLNEINKYDIRFRKYERFNETINDLFTAEAFYLLKSKGVFMIEPKKFTRLEIGDCNIAQITRNLLKPLLQKFRKQIIYSKINAKKDELIKYIGNDNFEELVDVVNKVDYLSRKGVASKIETDLDNPIVKEYYEQVERVNQIYMNIDEYYNKNFGVLTENDDFGCIKNR